EPLALVEAEHRDHAVVEQVIVDLKDQALAHFPSGEFNANGAWTVLGALAHNLLRWTQLIGLPGSTVRAARTLRRRLIQIPGRLTPAAPRPLALARRLPRRARAHPRAPRHLSPTARHPDHDQQTLPRTGALTDACQRPRAALRTAPPTPRPSRDAAEPVTDHI